MEHIILYRETGSDSLFKIWHKSRQHMIIYFYSDGGSIVCSENIYPIRKGALCFISAEKYHYTMPDCPEIYERSKLFFSQDYFKTILSFFPTSINSDASFIYAQIPTDQIAEVEGLFKEIQFHENDHKYYDVIYCSCCLKLFYYLNRYAVHSIVNSAGYISQTLDYINNHIFDDFEIDDICQTVHISKPYLCRQFKQKMGTTIMDYILKTRIVLAKNMLLENSASISEISSQCGFSSVSYFSRIFKKETGRSPLTYRKEHE